MGKRARERTVQRMDLAGSTERVGQLLTRLARPHGDTQRRSRQVTPVMSQPPA
jgi:hypothetical protein